MSSEVPQYPLPRLDFLVFFLRSEGNNYWCEKDPQLPFSFLFGEGKGRRYIALLLTSLDYIFPPQIAPYGRAHICHPFPVVPGLGGKEGNACLGTGVTGTNVLTSLTTSIPLPEVKWRVLW